MASTSPVQASTSPVSASSPASPVPGRDSTGRGAAGAVAVAASVSTLASTEWGGGTVRSCSRVASCVSIPLLGSHMHPSCIFLSRLGLFCPVYFPHTVCLPARRLVFVSFGVASAFPSPAVLVFLHLGVCVSAGRTHPTCHDLTTVVGRHRQMDGCMADMRRKSNERSSLAHKPTTHNDVIDTSPLQRRQMSPTTSDTLLCHASV